MKCDAWISDWIRPNRGVDEIKCRLTDHLMQSANRVFKEEKMAYQIHAVGRQYQRASANRKVTGKKERGENKKKCEISI